MAGTPLSDRSMEALLSGRGDDVVDDLADVAAVLHAVRRSAQRPSVPSADLLDLFADGAEPQPQPAPAAAATPPRRRRRLGALLGRLAALGVAGKLALVGIVGVAGLTSAGAVGALPDGLQDRVADAVATYTPFTFPDSAAEEAEVGERVSEEATEREPPGVDGPEVADDVSPVAPPSPLGPPVQPAQPDRELQRSDDTPAGQHLPDDHGTAGHERVPEDAPREPEQGAEHSDQRAARGAARAR